MAVRMLCLQNAFRITDITSTVTVYRTELFLPGWRGRYGLPCAAIRYSQLPSHRWQRKVCSLLPAGKPGTRGRPYMEWNTLWNSRNNTACITGGHCFLENGFFIINDKYYQTLPFHSYCTSRKNNHRNIMRCFIYSRQHRFSVCHHNRVAVHPAKRQNRSCRQSHRVICTTRFVFSHACWTAPHVKPPRYQTAEGAGLWGYGHNHGQYLG